MTGTNGNLIGMMLVKSKASVHFAVTNLQWRLLDHAASNRDLIEMMPAKSKALVHLAYGGGHWIVARCNFNWVQPVKALKW